MMTFDEYASINATNWSKLKAIARSPKHYRHALSAPSVDTPAYMLGRAAHTAILEPEELDNRVAVWRGGDRRFKEAKAAWAEFQETSKGKDVLTVEQYDHVTAMATAVRAHHDAAKYLDCDGPVEHVIEWTDSKTDIACKCRLDKLLLIEGSRVPIELKTASDISPKWFARSAWDYQYHGQLAFYCRAAQATHSPIVIAVESHPPYDVAVYRLGDKWMDAGDRMVDECLATLRQCQEADEWPGQVDGVQELELPAYADVGEDEDLDWSAT